MQEISVNLQQCMKSKNILYTHISKENKVGVILLPIIAKQTVIEIICAMAVETEMALMMIQNEIYGVSGN